MKFSSLVQTTIATLGISASAFAQTSATWNQDVNANWAVDGNWNYTSGSSFPNNAGDTASLTNNITAARTVTLTQNITVGTLNIGDSGSTFFAFTVNATGTNGLTFNNSGSNATINLVNNLAGGGNAGGLNVVSANITLNDNLVVFGDTTVTNDVRNGIRLSGVINDGASSYSITKTGRQMLELNGNNAFDGGVILNGGRLHVGNVNGAGTGRITLTGVTTLSTAASINNEVEVQVAASGSFFGRTGSTGAGIVAVIAGPVKLGEAGSSGTVTLNVNANSNSSVISGDISKVTSGAATIQTSSDGGAAGFQVISGNVTGNINLTLQSANAYTQIGGAGKTQNWGTLTHANGSTLVLDGNASFTNTTGGNSTTVIRGGSASTTSFLTISGSTNSTFAGVIGTAGNATHNNIGLVKGGSSTLILSGANTFTGGIRQDSGNITLSGATATLGAITNNVTITAGTLGINGTTQSIGALNGSGGVVSLGAGNLTVGNGNFDATFSGNITGSGNFAKTGIGNQTLAGATVFTGNTNVNAGNLTLSAANALGSTGNVSVATDATLRITVSEAINNAANVTLGGGTIERGSGVSETFGALVLTANSTLNFGTGTIGSLTFNGTGSLYSSSFQLNVTDFAVGNQLIFRNYGNMTSLVNNASLFSFSNGFTTTWDNGTSTFTITAVPEPTAVAAAALFLGLAAWRARGRRNAGEKFRKRTGQRSPNARRDFPNR